MGISDADPAGTPQDSPEVAALKARIAELEKTRTAPATPAELAPAVDVGTPGTPPPPAPGAGPEVSVDEPPATVEDTNPEVAALQQQLKDKQAEIDNLTNQALAQKDPSTADPSVDVKALLNQLVQAQTEYRQEIGQLRNELAKVRRQPIPTSTVRQLSPEELHALRMTDIENAGYYCPGCGALYQRERECTGDPASPHPAIEVTSTAELRNPPDSADKEAVAEYQAGHTEMVYSDPHIQATLLG